MRAKPAHKPKLGKTPIRIVIGTAIICAGLALLYNLWLPVQGALHAPGTVVVIKNGGLPSPSLSSYVPRMFSFSSSSAVAQEEMTAGSLDESSGGAVVKALSLDPLVGQKGRWREEENTEGKEDKEDEADRDKDGSQKGNVDEQQQYEESESREVMEEEWDDGTDQDGNDDDFLSEEVGEEEEEEEEEDDGDEGKEEEEVLDTVKPKNAAASNSITVATITEEEEEGAITLLAECQTSYGDRRFLHEDEKALPPILYSFPGKSVSKSIQHFPSLFIDKFPAYSQGVETLGLVFSLISVREFTPVRSLPSRNLSLPTPSCQDKAIVIKW